MHPDDTVSDGPTASVATIIHRIIETRRDLPVGSYIRDAAVAPAFGRGHHPPIRVGKPASRFIAGQVVTRGVFDRYRTHASWLIPRPGPDRYPIEVVSPQQILRRTRMVCRLPD